MHAIERPHLPRIGVIALSAALLALVALLLAAWRLGGTTMSSGVASSGASSVAPVEARSAVPATSSWFTNPFAAPFRVDTPWNKTSRS
jgi:hypothetical protein